MKRLLVIYPKTDGVDVSKILKETPQKGSKIFYNDVSYYIREIWYNLDKKEIKIMVRDDGEISSAC